MTTARKIKSAIDRSISHNEIVHITIDGDSGDAIVAIDEVTDYNDVDTDYVMLDREGVDTMDVWAFKPGAPDGEMVWRLAIQFCNN